MSANLIQRKNKIMQRVEQDYQPSVSKVSREEGKF